MSLSRIQAPLSKDHDISISNETKPDMWSSMLDSVASGKSLPEKNIIMLGGTSESQRQFLESLSSVESKLPQNSQNNKKPPTANHLALGYTYLDVLDADHEDTLARLSIFLLSDPSPSFTPLLQPLLTPRTIPNTLVVILLDWSQPWLWLRQLYAWIRLLRTLIISLDDQCKETMENTMNSWKEKGRGIKSVDGITASTFTEEDICIPLGSGEWDEALGVPLCVVCQNSDWINHLERERGWKDDEFDFILQFLRTILLKHGASLIYTASSMTNTLPSLVHSSLGIHSLLKPQPLKHNVIDRDRVLVPPNWDSWGKIRVLRDGFDVEAVSEGWSFDIAVDSSPDNHTPSNDPIPDCAEELSISRGAISYFEKVIQDPSLDALQITTTDCKSCKLDVVSQETQKFLAAQLEILESTRLETESSGTGNTRYNRGRQYPTTNTDRNTDRDDLRENEIDINEHIGPVKFNMGGIQVDADDILQRLKNRQNYHTPEPTASGVLPITSQNDALASFFEGLMHRGGVGTPNNPKSKSP